MNSKTPPLLTIAIPTWNRAEYLRKNLEQLATQWEGFSHILEVLVSDNCSSDETPQVIEELTRKGMPIRYIRNAENIGSDRNMAQCFNLAAGRYVMILGDDDLLVDGALPLLLRLLEKGNYGVVGLRPYGYEHDFRREYPGGGGSPIELRDVGAFVEKLGIFSTLISANVISKELLAGIDANAFCDTNLVQTYLVYRAAIAAECNVWFDRYLVACKRNNSGGYDFSHVFVENLGAILDDVRGKGIPEVAIARLERRLLIAYYPSYIWRQRLAGGEHLDMAWKRFRGRYGGYMVFWLCIAPILRLPRALALAWGVGVIALGRAIDGDFWRGLNFACHRLSRMVIRH